MAGANPRDFSRTELESGVRVLTEKVPGVRSVSLGVWIDAGSRDEALGEEGLTHFLEHLIFKGTDRFSAREIAEAFENIGSDINAATGREHTSIYTRVLDRDLPEALDVIMDMVRGSVMDPGETDFERKVLLEEIAMHMDSPDELVHDHLAVAMWGDHPIGHSVLGEARVIEQVDRESLLSFRDSRYVGLRIVVSAAGAVDHDALLSAVSSLTEGLLPGKPSDRSHSLARPLSGNIVFGKETEQAHVCVGSMGLRRNHPDRFALAVMDNMLGGSMSSRLFQSIREKRGLSYAVGSYTALFIGMGMVGIYCGTHPGQVQEVIDIIESELAAVRESGFTEEEIARAKNHIAGSLFISMEDSGNRMNTMAKAELAGGEHLEVEEMVARVEKVTASDVEKVFSETWRGAALSLAVVGPFDEGDIALSGKF